MLPKMHELYDKVSQRDADVINFMNSVFYLRSSFCGIICTVSLKWPIKSNSCFCTSLCYDGLSLNLDNH